MNQFHPAGRPSRWDKTFGPEEMAAEDVDRVLALPVFADIDPDDFPNDLALRDIIANDGRIKRFSRGDIIVRSGDYGNSFFVILHGGARGFASVDGELAFTSRGVAKKSWFEALSQLWRNSKVAEFREAVRYDPAQTKARSAISVVVDRMTHLPHDRGRLRQWGRSDAVGTYQTGTDATGTGDAVSSEGTGDEFVTRFENIDEIISEFPTFQLNQGEAFGELAALARAPRTATIFADTDNTEVMELRWQGLRDIRRWSDPFKRYIDDLYRERGLSIRLRSSPVFQNVDDETLDLITKHTLFETYGDFEWTHPYRRAVAGDGSEHIIESEPIISEEDHYLDGVLLIHSGFARISQKFDRGEKTIGYLTRDDVFGLEELIGFARDAGDLKLKRSLRAIGYVDVLRVPTALVEEHVLPTLDPTMVENLSRGGGAGTPHGEELEQSLMDFLVDNRVINGTAAMIVNTDRCVNCDDCVRACGNAHDGNPRFVRHGMTFRNLMVTNACMHCVDPVCLIGCPTGAIHRDDATGKVVIDDATCVGCATCANSCPYNNIRMVETRDADGDFIIDADKMPILKATKCDYCIDQLGGPACQRACPHGALVRIDIRDPGTISNWLS